MSGHTPGPWEWVEDRNGKYLATPDRGRLVVMDFSRRGMNQAQARFAVWEGIWQGKERERLGGIMRHSMDIVLKDHPDALLIAAAPKLLEALRKMLLSQDCEWENRNLGHDWAEACAFARAEILKATRQKEEA